MLGATLILTPLGLMTHGLAISQADFWLVSETITSAGWATSESIVGASWVISETITNANWTYSDLP